MQSRIWGKGWYEAGLLQSRGSWGGFWLSQLQLNHSK